MLVASIHDVSPSRLTDVQRIRDQLAAVGVARVTLLAVPNYHQLGRLTECPATVRWLRQRQAAGDEVALHGFYHEERGDIRGIWQRARSRTWTANEGELLALKDAQLAVLLDRGRDMIASITGTTRMGFVAPAWLERRSAKQILALKGFLWHESKWTLESLTSERSFVSPAIGFATRTLARSIASSACSEIISKLLLASGRRVIRVAIHPDDTTREFVWRNVVSVLRAVAKERDAVTSRHALGLV